MATDGIGGAIDRAVAKLRQEREDAEREIARLGGRMVEIDAAVAKLESLRAAAGDVDAVLGAGEPMPTHFERIAEVLRGRASTIAEIAAETGIPVPSVSAVLYRTHRERFKCFKIPGKRPKGWCLAEKFAGEVPPC